MQLKSNLENTVSLYIIIMNDIVCIPYSKKLSKEKMFANFGPFVICESSPLYGVHLVEVTRHHSPMFPSSKKRTFIGTSALK